ncbi:proline dehydrogenase [Bacteroidetes bacterium UKL13-3]|jgi:proline dehydrogenase|nr:proline dehydrogenase [Bacteroidetes bacterium UKL13-3]HCP93042.1 proline dehydrogenase [Bacteroidota bacterium]
MPQAATFQSATNLSLENTEIAFRSKSNSDLQRSYYLFKAIGYNWLVKLGPPMVEFAFNIHLPITGIIKATVFKQFCGGETIDDSVPTIKHLDEYGIGSILDYSVEGKEEEKEFEHTTEETLLTIDKATNNPQIPFCVFKVTGLARFNLLAKVNAKEALSVSEQEEFDKVKNRVERICRKAFDNKVRIFIDAEETWIQDTIDALAREMMLKFNKETATVYNTIQLYRHDRLAFLKQSYEDALKHNYYLGVKLVRGAYMEKEAARALALGYPNPIQPTKQSCDNDYDAALTFCVEKIDRISICAGTHNEQSSMLLDQLMQKHSLAPNDKRIYFSQLFGMSDHISFNLSSAGYNVAKYLPYGPVKSVMPYLFRRAAENTSVKGQSGRELTLISKEVKRRKAAKR